MRSSTGADPKGSAVQTHQGSEEEVGELLLAVPKHPAHELWQAVEEKHTIKTAPNFHQYL